MIVVDEQGNEYEATYPKRAKGLVKNGRARFVDENKICLACPPDKILEETEMSNNKLTAKEIFVQLTILQKQLTESNYTSLHNLRDAISSIGEEYNDSQCEHIEDVCNVFETREATLHRILELYEKMYNDVRNEETTKVNLIKSAFDNNMAMIIESDLSAEDKRAALDRVTDKIAKLVDKVVVNK